MDHIMKLMARFAFLLGEAAAKDPALDKLFSEYMEVIPDAALRIAQVWKRFHWRKPFDSKRHVAELACRLFSEKGKVYAPAQLDFPQDRIPALQAYLIGYKSVSAAEGYVREYTASLSDKQLFRLASQMPDELTRPAETVKAVFVKVDDTALRHAAAKDCYVAIQNHMQTYHHRRRDAKKVSPHVLRSVGWCKRCGAPLFKSENPEYVYQCFGCEEDFYAFEQQERRRS